METETTNQKPKRQKVEGEEQFRVVISREANEALERIVQRVNEGDHVTATKSDVANYIFRNIPRFVTEADIREIRSLYFSEEQILNAIVRRAKRGEALPDEVKHAIREHFGLTLKEKKRGPKTGE